MVICELKRMLKIVAIVHQITKNSKMGLTAMPEISKLPLFWKWSLHAWRSRCLCSEASSLVRVSSTRLELITRIFNT